MFDRKFGIILPVFSLPSRYGIGSLGQKAFDFIDYLYNSRVGLWQVLPLGPTSYGNSPYQSFSAFAGNEKPPRRIDKMTRIATTSLRAFDLYI